jgi:hypothetical protein
MVAIRSADPRVTPPRSSRAWLLTTLVAAPLVAACSGSAPAEHASPSVAYASWDAGAPDGERVVACPETPRGCDLPEGDYVPVIDGDAEVVWTPSGGRYTNEPTLVRDGDGQWHVFANSTTGQGDPWSESQLVHARAPSLAGPWTELPDAVTARDPGSNDRELWAPFAMREGTGLRLVWAAQNLALKEELHEARSQDALTWTRSPTPLPGGRDPMIFSLPDGRQLLYTVATLREADGVHDAVSVFEAPSPGAPFTGEVTALRDPNVCPANCWGFYESPYVVEVGGQYYLFTTWTDSLGPTYERTAVFRSRDPKHFENPPITFLQAHGGELHVEDGRMWLTRGGWPHWIGEARRGLSIAPIAWVRVD